MTTQNLTGYKCFYKGKSVDIYAESSYKAQQAAVIYFKIPARKGYLIAVVACERPDGSTIKHCPSEVC